MEGEAAETSASMEEAEEVENREEEEEEDEEEERCDLEFEEGTDPIDLVHRTDNGVDLFKQFERLEYEALAERNRKTLQDQSTDGVEPVKQPNQDEFLGATMEEIDEMMNFGIRKRKKRGELRKKGRKKGSRKKLTPQVSRRLGDATLHYASGEYKEAIPLLHEVVRLAPNLPDGYHLLGQIHDSMGDRKKAFNFFMIAAFFTPKDASLWRKLVLWSMELKDVALMKHCLLKAIAADPNDLGLKFDGASFYFGAGKFHKSAEMYEQILAVDPVHVVARKMAAKMYDKCGRLEKAIQILEDYVNINPKPDMSVTSLLASLYISNNMHIKALGLIDLTCNVHESEIKRLPFDLQAKSVICHAFLGDTKHAGVFLQNVPLEHSEEVEEAVAEVSDSLFKMGKYDIALKFYFLWEQIVVNPNGELYEKIAKCYIAMEETNKGIAFYYKALNKMEEHVEIRMTLASHLLEEGKEDETIILLLPPQNSDKMQQNVERKKYENMLLHSSTPNAKSVSDATLQKLKPWWQNAQIKIKLAKIYRDQGLLEDFANTIFSSVRETLIIESINQKVRPVKKLSKNILKERAKLLDEQQPDNVFHGFRPLAKPTDLLKAARAKRSLEKISALKEEKKSAAIAAGLNWQSDNSDEELPRRVKKEPPFPGFLQEPENHILLVDLCKALASLQRYWDSLEIINKTLKVANDIMSYERKEDLRSLGAQIAYGTSDLRNGFDYVRYIVQQHPSSNAAWNCYYKVVSRLEDRYTRHNKFIRNMRSAKNLVPPIVISGHQFNNISQHQAASADYLEAYKLQPDNPLINLCVGTSLVNLALGFRLQEKHQCILQAFAFLYNYLRLCDNSQEALYNIARAYHHVGLVTLATSYYEKVLGIKQKDEPVPRLPYEDKLPLGQNGNYDYCDLRREAGYNLHLIYKKSGAIELAKQILRNYCSV